MPKHKKPKPTRRSERKTTKKSTAKTTRNQYLKKSTGLTRTRSKPSRYVPCPRQSSPHTGAWAPAPVTAAESDIVAKRALGVNTNPSVEKLGEQGSKWYMNTQVLGKAVPDADPNSGFKKDSFVTFNGGYTVDMVYVDSSTNHVYVVESKGVQKGGSANLITRVSGKTQGTFSYLDEVVGDMQNSGDARKIAAADAISNAPAGKLHYIGIKTTYEVKQSGLVDAQKPSEIFNMTR